VEYSIRQNAAGASMNTDNGVNSRVQLEYEHNFVDRTRQELSRAERYCLFLSVILIDMNDLSRALANRNLGEKIDLDEVCRAVEKNLRESLRASDIVSPCEKHRIGLLLMETSRSGLEIVRRRIDSFLRDFLRAALRLPFEPEVTVKDASFPEEPDQFSDLAETLARYQTAYPPQS
jgi:GGDEF domain-containing protein